MSKLNDREQRFMKAAHGLTAHETARVVNKHARDADYAKCPKGYMATQYGEGRIAETVIAALKSAERATAERKAAALDVTGGPPGPPSVDVQHGKTYRLVRDVINPTPDRRSSDWRDQPVITAGTLIRGGRPWTGPGPAHPTIYSGQYEHQDLISGESQRGDLYDRIVAALEPVDDFRAFLHEMSAIYGAGAAELLEEIENTGAISRGHIREAAKAIYARDRAEYDRAKAHAMRPLDATDEESAT